MDTRLVHHVMYLFSYVSAFTGTHCAYSLRDGQAELTWVAWLHTVGKWYTCEKSPIPVLTWLRVV